jgi:AraC family transcriptional regulator, transcriptional activator of pobA
MEARTLAVDRLTAGALRVVLLEDASVGEESVREPHRHDYHELVWTKEGSGSHLLDGEPVPVRPGSITLIGRGSVHVFERAEGLTGAVVQFGEELLFGGEAGLVTPGWLLAGRCDRTVPVPPEDVEALESTIAALARETDRQADQCSTGIERHLISTILLWIERWYDAARTERRAADDAEVQLLRRFSQRLEADFAGHHDAAHYADALAIPQAALSRALVQVTGRSTKELITDRVMLEAARLLRFTDQTVGEVSHAVGFEDPLYFSRAFKRRFEVSPRGYRDAVRGR